MTIVGDAVFNTTIARTAEIIEKTGVPQVYWRVWRTSKYGKYMGELDGWKYGRGAVLTKEGELVDVIEEILTRIRLWDSPIVLGLE